MKATRSARVAGDSVDAGPDLLELDSSANGHTNGRNAIVADRLAERRRAIARLYVEERRNAPEIAERLGFSEATVLADLDRAGVPRRPPGRRALTLLERRAEAELAASLYRRGASQADIASQLGISERTVQRYLRELGVEIRPPGRKPLYPRPEPRLCECGCGNVVSWAKPSEAAHGRGRYVSREHRAAAERVYPEPGERVCKNPRCGKRFRPAPEHAARSETVARFCSAQCYRTSDHFANLGRERLSDAWARGIGLARGAAARTRDDGTPWFGGRTRQKLLGRWNGWRGGAAGAEGGHKKGEAAALRTIDLALRAVAKRPNLTRRQLIELLILNLEGREAIYAPDGSRRSRRDDPVYRGARKRIERRLERGFTLRGSPDELAPLTR
jgi:DNA-binding CsgD family transcriptional regulator